MAWRGQSLQAPVSHCREPASWVRIRKPPRWSAERGPGRPGTGWSRVAGATERKSAPVGAPSPLIGGTGLLLSRRPPVPNSPPDAKAKAHAKRRTNPDAATRRGNEETTLFDIVKRIPTTAHARAAMSRAGCAPLTCPGRASVSERRPGTQGRHGKIDVHVAPRSRVSLRSPGTRTHCAISRDGVTFPIAGATRPVQRKPTKPPSAS